MSIFAVILAAGLGSRLGPLTEKIPKAMVKVGSKPLLWYNVQQLKKYGIKEIWINLHYFPKVIQQFFGNGSKFGVRISYSHEPKLLGTAGALKNTSSKISQSLSNNTFLVVYGDNLTDINYSQLINYHKRNHAFMTIALYRDNTPWTKGVVEIDKTGNIKSIIEKPPKDKIKSNLVNAGIYVCEPEVLNFIPSKFSDFGFDIIPKLLSLNKKITGFAKKFYIQDIGTIGGLKKARIDLESGQVDI